MFCKVKQNGFIQQNLQSTVLNGMFLENEEIIIHLLLEQIKKSLLKQSQMDELD